MRRAWLVVAVVLTGCAGVGTATPNTNGTATRGAELTHVAAVLMPSATSAAPSVAPSVVPAEIATETPRPFTAPWYTAEAAKTPSSAAATPMPLAATIPATTVSATPTQPATLVPSIASALQSVTVVDGPANVRQGPNPNAPILATLDTGTEVQFVEGNVAGTDGATRYVHVNAAGKDGYIRGDLVGPPHAPSARTPASSGSPATTGSATKIPTGVAKNFIITLYDGLDDFVKPGFFGPSPGNRCVAFDVGFRNTSGKTILATDLDAKLKTRDNRVYTFSLTCKGNVTPFFNGGDVPPGQEVRGWVFFEIPQGIDIAAFSWETFGDGSVTFTKS